VLRQKAVAVGERGSVVAEMRQSAVLLSRLIVCVALSTVAVSVALLPFAMALPMTGVNPALTNLDTVNVGMLLLLIPLSLPGAWLSLGLFFAPPVLIVKKLGPIDAMRQSFRLLRGNWWRTSVLSAALLGVLLLMLVVAATLAGVAADDGRGLGSKVGAHPGHTVGYCVRRPSWCPGAARWCWP